MIRRHQLVLIITMSMTVILLAGCGLDSSTSGTDEPSPTPTATTGPVTLHVGLASYHPNDTIEVTLSNAGTSTIYFPDHMTNCTTIQLRRQVNRGWEVINKCLLKIATHWHALDAGQSLIVKLVPLAGHLWVIGLYQATLSYKTSLEPGPLVLIYSTGFQIT
ncbi:MAG: hypothetical protein NVSMB33_06930 [Ktedonobacteraceae bacterium]